LQTRFAKFTLDVLLTEVQGWLAEGLSIFDSELAALKQSRPAASVAPANFASG
jgi:hypothetical protein